MQKPKSLSAYMKQRQRNEHDFKAQFVVTDSADTAAREWRHVQIRKGRRGPDEGSRQEMQVYDTPD